MLHMLRATRRSRASDAGGARTTQEPRQGRIAVSDSRWGALLTFVGLDASAVGVLASWSDVCRARQQSLRERIVQITFLL